MDKAELAKRDMQIEKKIANMIYDNVFVGLENGQVRLHYVEEIAEKIREYFDSMNIDPTATW